MKAASITIQTIAFTALFAVYVSSHGSTGLSGVRRALQTIGATVDVSVTTPVIADQA
jgi:hypothetical protein